MKEKSKLVIISNKIDEAIRLPLDSEYKIIKTSNIKNDIDAIIPPVNEDSLFIILFIHIDELDYYRDNLANIQNHQLFYEYVIFGTENEIKETGLKSFLNISEIRMDKIDLFDFELIVKKTFNLIDEKLKSYNDQRDCEGKLNDTKQDQEDLINIGKSLSSEKDPDKLLTLILFLSKKITGADAGSIYLIEEDDEGKKRLRFKYSHTFSREIPLEEFVMVMDKKSIAGYVAVTGEVLNIPNAYNLSTDAPYSFNSSFDENHNYICRSMLVVPMRNHTDEIIGVIQLINSKEDLYYHNSGESDAFRIKLETPADFDKYVFTFDEKYDSLLEAIAGQAAIAIENNRLIKQIQRQFEEFVKASVTAIESRDPATSGHSFRVAEVCKRMALAINNVNEGYFKDYTFDENALRELEFAALLHDFGKVYIDFAIFQKQNKLFPKDFKNLILRMGYLYRYVELQYILHENLIFQDTSISNYKEKLEKVKNDKVEKLSRIKSIINKIREMNEPTVLDYDPREKMDEIIEELYEIECVGIEGGKFELITDLDEINLTIKKGSLNPDERKEIQSHVVRTYDFVKMIPWPPEYKNIPEIALRHHEVIDGTGYPDGLKGRESTLLQSRIMTIADIFDALAASDRPYKKAVPMEKVLEILSKEAQMGKLDVDLVDLFINQKIYQEIKSGIN